jgi:ATP-dependent DNA ligase
MLELDALYGHSGGVCWRSDLLLRRLPQRLLSHQFQVDKQSLAFETPSRCVLRQSAAIFRHACGLGFEGIVSKRIGSGYVSGRTRAWLKTKDPSLSVADCDDNDQLDRLIAELGKHPLARGKRRKVGETEVYVSVSNRSRQLRICVLG